MKTTILLMLIGLFINFESNAQTEFELNPSQSMLMTGKGPGQDGAINPYYGKECIAIVKNMGESDFLVRIQKRGAIVEMIPVSGNETKKIKLLADHELYIDANDDQKIKLELDFKEIE